MSGGKIPGTRTRGGEGEGERGTKGKEEAGRGEILNARSDGYLRKACTRLISIYVLRLVPLELTYVDCSISTYVLHHKTR